ncbi:MAG: site-specific DNA-methyltransferase [Deltaproteobacteria bacterium]|nr:MAG: site-specific DNA-methyltransferase [Deltaproteobacteria bacterium]
MTEDELFFEESQRHRASSIEAFDAEIRTFTGFGKKTRVLEFTAGGTSIPLYVNEFWTSKQRAAHSIHEISYRACFKPQLPRFFIRRLTRPGDVVYDPFLGRGTTVIEAALAGRRPLGCDVNPLSRILVLPRLDPPEATEVANRLASLDLERPVEVWEDLLVFYHPKTLRQITHLRAYLLSREAEGTLDRVDAWIRMVATNRLTGHSPGFFSVYTLPPNQAVSIEAQRRINAKRNQVPPEREVKRLILRKTRSLLAHLSATERKRLRHLAKDAVIVTGSSDTTPEIPSDSVTLVVTSPPFLDTVDYRTDNWLRCWFNGIDVEGVQVWRIKDPEAWQSAMASTFRELRRVLVDGGIVAFEVGEVRNGKILLETLVVPAAIAAGLQPRMVLVNDQIFTKTSNCWGVDNLKKGTNTNRIVVVQKG